MTEITLGPITRWLLEQGFEMKMTIKWTTQGWVECVRLIKGDEVINRQGYCKNIEDAAADYLDQKIRTAIATVNAAEMDKKFWTYHAKKFGAIK